MKRIASLAVIGLLSWGTPALGGPRPPGSCDDGIAIELDNCQDACNPIQDDHDGDDCGNLCDADYDNDGTVGFADFGAFTAHFGTTNELYNHTEPVQDAVGFGDFGFFTTRFGLPPGPSGTTIGTIACP